MDGEQNRKRPVTLTREELYAQVWQVPMSRLAARYGVTGNGLAKICDRLRIPCPPRGHWAKKAAGKRIVTHRLPEADGATPKTVTIAPTPPSRKGAEPSAEVKGKVEATRAAATPVAVPERLVRPHPIVVGWLADHARRKREARRERNPLLRGLYDPGGCAPSDRRRHRVLDALFKALERRGAKVKEGERRTLSGEILGETVAFQIREKQKQVRRPLTGEEKRFSSDRDGSRRQELQPTGKLLFAVKSHLPDGVRTEWLESDGKPMEALLPDIVATFVAAGPLLVERRRQREEAERRRRLVDLAGQWREAAAAATSSSP